MWKDHFLKSGVPLEYEVAKILASQNFFLNADFSFFRRDVAGIKEWSVDIVADSFGPNDDEIGFSFSALIECKYSLYFFCKTLAIIL